VTSYAAFNQGLVKQYDRWMVANHYAKATMHIYNRSLQQYIQFLGKHRSIATVEHTDVVRYVAHVSENGASLGAVYRDLGVLRMFYDFLHLGGVVHYVTPRFIRLRRPWWGSPPPLSESQIERLLNAARSLRDRAIVEFMYGTGCRLSEVTHLRVEDIDFQAKIARVVGKLGKKRIVLLTDRAVEAVQSYLKGRQKGILFQPNLRAQTGCLTAHNGSWYSLWFNPRGRRTRRHRKFLGRVEQLTFEEAKRKHDEFIASLHLQPRFQNVPLSKMAIQKSIQNMSERAGLRRVSAHTLRRTFATHLFEHGAGIEIVKTLLGHVWINTTMKYTRIGPDRLNETFRRCHPRANLDEQRTP